MRSPAAACSSRPRRCSAPARSSSAAPTTSSRSLAPTCARGGVVAFSSGNHAQGVAAAAKLLGMPAVIVMPQRRAAAEARAHRGARRRGRALRPRARGPRGDRARDRRGARRGAGAALRRSLVIAGQGTVGREIVEEIARLGLDASTCVVGQRVGRRTDRRDRARGEGAGAGGAASTPPSRPASTITRARSAAASASATRRSPARSAMR